MPDQTDLDAAVAQGTITAEQAAALREMAAQRERERAAVLGHEERFRFLRGFNDVFFTIGVVLFLVGAAFFTPPGAPGHLLMAAMVWGLAEVLVRRLRLVLPGIVLATAFVFFVFVASVQLPAESWLGLNIHLRLPSELSVLQALQFYPGGPLAFTARALVPAAAAAAFYWRFKLPFALLPLAASLVLAALGVASVLLPRAGAVSDTVVFLLCGLGVFAAAMGFDASDRERRTRRADCAFWLHLLAAPLIVRSVMTLVAAPIANGQILFDRMSGTLPLVVMATVAALAVVAVVIDRRALLVSGLAYLGWAIGFTLAGVGGVGMPGGGASKVAATLVILGALVLTLGVGWVPLRRFLLALLPPALANRLPPVPTPLSSRP
jgi:hypothetical protein